MMEIIRELDPDGVEKRKKKRLKRRIYSVPGPDAMWHIDGYDKLKPFGFSIHGCVDGYSRRIMWLEVGTTNKCPEVIAYNFIQTVKQINGLPTRIRSDDGTENSMIEAMQICLRSDHHDEFKGCGSFCIGTSPANQKIECFWSQLTKDRPMWWRGFFIEMSNLGFIDKNSIIIIECLRYCFMDIIRKEITEMALRWNRHLLAPSKHSLLPRGRPDTLYFAPQLTGSMSYKKEVDLDALNEFDCPELSHDTADNKTEFIEFAETVLEMRGYPKRPSSLTSAFETYFILLEAVEEHL